MGETVFGRQQRLNLCTFQSTGPTTPLGSILGQVVAAPVLLCCHTATVSCDQATVISNPPCQLPPRKLHGEAGRKLDIGPTAKAFGILFLCVAKEISLR